jgi:hypothetical protein
MISALAVSLILTIVFETGFYLLIGKRNKKDLLLVVLVNVLTNPVVVTLYWLATLHTSWSYVVTVTPLELFAVLTEGFYYKRYGQDFSQPYLFSVAANMFSYGAGELLWKIL